MWKQLGADHNHPEACFGHTTPVPPILFYMDRPIHVPCGDMERNEITDRQQLDPDKAQYPGKRIWLLEHHSDKVEN